MAPKNSKGKSAAPAPGASRGDGFTLQPETLEQLSRNADDLRGRLSTITGGLRGLHLPPGALGPIGMATVPSFNQAADQIVGHADKASSILDNVNSGIKSTRNAYVDTDQSHADIFKKVDPSTSPPTTRDVAGPPRQAPQQGPAVRRPGTVNGGPLAAPPGKAPVSGPAVSKVTAIRGGSNTVAAAADHSGPAVGQVPSVRNTGTTPAGATRTNDGPTVAPVTPPRGTNDVPNAAPTKNNGPAVTQPPSTRNTGTTPAGATRTNDGPTVAPVTPPHGNTMVPNTPAAKNNGPSVAQVPPVRGTGPAPATAPGTGGPNVGNVKPPHGSAPAANAPRSANFPPPHSATLKNSGPNAPGRSDVSPPPAGRTTPPAPPRIGSPAPTTDNRPSVFSPPHSLDNPRGPGNPPPGAPRTGPTAVGPRPDPANPPVAHSRTGPANPPVAGPRPGPANPSSRATGGPVPAPPHRPGDAPSTTRLSDASPTTPRGSATPPSANAPKATAPIPNPRITTTYTVSSPNGAPPFQSFDSLHVSNDATADLDSFPAARLSQPHTSPAHPPLQVAPDGTVAINGTNPVNGKESATEAKEFFATKETIAKARAALRKADSNVDLITHDTAITTLDGVPLFKVTPDFQETPPDVCRDVARDVLGGMPDTAVFRGPAGTKTAPVNATSSVEVTGTHALADALANPGAPVSPEWAASQVAADTRPTGGDGKAVLPGERYGTAVKNDTLDHAGAGINQSAWAKPGEGYLVHSIGSPNLENPMSVNHARSGPVGAVWGYHFATVVAESADGRTQVTLENYSRGGELRRTAERAVDENLHTYRGRFGELEQHWQAKLAEADDPRAVREAQQKLDLAKALKTAEQGGDRRPAIEAILRTSDTPRPSDQWHFKMYSRDPGQTFHEQQAVLYDTEAPANIVNPITMVVVGGHSAIPAADVNFDRGSATVTEANDFAVNSLARKVARTAIWRHDNGLPLPEVAVTGHSNGRTIGIGTAMANGQARADATARQIQTAVAGMLDMLQGDDARISAQDVKVVPTSEGRRLGAPHPYLDPEEQRRRTNVSVSLQ